MRRDAVSGYLDFNSDDAHDEYSEENESVAAGKWTHWAVFVAAIATAIFGVRPFAGSWNDGSRLACIESLVDRNTFIIDDSIFVKVPPASSNPIRPYADYPEQLNSSGDSSGTLDKLFINGHYYSDKSPVPNVLGAAFYRIWRSFGGPSAAERPDSFCLLLTIALCGAAYVFSVVCINLLAREIGLTPRTAALVTASFAFATFAPTYARQLNGHILQLAPVSGICLILARSVRLKSAGWIAPSLLGMSAGFGYGCDLGLGPGLVLATFLVGGFVFRSPRAIALMLLGAVPWIALHHVLNYRVGGTIVPANSVVEYLQWENSPFNESNITSGGMKHSWHGFILYALEMLFGKQGFLFHNLALWLVPGSIWLLARGRVREPRSDTVDIRPAIWFLMLFCGSGWLLYAASSTNMSGRCCSIRWFVPFLAPGYWVVCLLLRYRPEFTHDFLWLTMVGTFMGVLMWVDGPWSMHMVPGLWAWVATAALGWGMVRFRAANS